MNAKYASKLLGWLVCARRPLKWHEIQGAIAIDLETQTIDFEKRKLWVDSKHLCGSLVEIRAGGTIELVHTTAKLYLVTHEYVIESKEVYDLCQLCLGYLNHPCIDHQLPGDVLKQYVLDGHYAFLDYAIVNWISHLEDCMRHIKEYESTLFKQLAGEVQRFLDRHFLEEDLDYAVSRETKRKLQPFKNESFCVQLMQTFEYWKNETENPGKRMDNCHMVDLNLVLEAIRSIIEDLALQYPSLESFYGEEMFKCSRLYCKFFYEGFATPERRIQHDQQHERSFLCMFPNCPASQLGFSSDKELDAHITRCHQLLASGDDEFPIYQDPTSIDAEHACATGNIAAIERWAGRFTPQELVDKAGFGYRGLRSPLRIAIAGEQYAIVKILLEKTLEPGKHVYRVINWACATKKYLILKSSLEIPRVISVTLERSLQLRVLTLLARHEDSLARSLLEYIYGCTSWLLNRSTGVASRFGCLSSLQYFVEKGQDPNIPERNTKLNALGIAARYGQTKVVRYLIDHQLCSIDLVIPQVKNTLLEAAVNGYEIIIQIMFPKSLTHQSVERALRIARLRNAACHGEAETVQRLLEHDDVPLTSRDSYGFTPLLHAVKSGHWSVVSLLLSSGRDVGINMKCYCNYQKMELFSKRKMRVRGSTALILAAFYGHLAIARALLQCEGIETGEKVLTKAGGFWEYKNALEIAEWKNHTEIIGAIQEYNAAHKNLTQTKVDSVSSIIQEIHTETENQFSQIQTEYLKLSQAVNLRIQRANSKTY